MGDVGHPARRSPLNLSPRIPRPVWKCSQSGIHFTPRFRWMSIHGIRRVKVMTSVLHGRPRIIGEGEEGGG